MESKPIVISQSGLRLFEFNKLVKEWDVDFIQLGYGSFLSNVEQVIFPGFQLGYIHFNSRVKQEGRSPKGHWTFAFVNDVEVYWRNFKVSPNSVIVYAPDSEINGVSDSRFDVPTFSIEESILLKLARQTNTKGLMSKLKSGLLLSKGGLREDLRNQIFKEISQYKNNPGYDGKNSFMEEFTTSLFELIEISKPSTQQVSSKKWLQLLVDAEHFIQKNIREKFSVVDIAMECGVSERTLLYAFKNRFNVGPKSYIRILKLNYVYNLLHREAGKIIISNIAREFGFWHMGQFHNDYKKFFGELPSETVARATK